jgi:hypothetical protein
MISIKTALYQYLSTHHAVVAVIGTHVYPQAAPTSTVQPYVTMQRLTHLNDRHLVGVTDLAHLTMQLDSWALSSCDNEQVTEALRQALDGYRGSMAGVAVEYCAVINEFDSYEPPTDGSEQGIFHTAMDVEMWHRRD